MFFSFRLLTEYGASCGLNSLRAVGSLGLSAMKIKTWKMGYMRLQAKGMAVI